MNSRIDNIKTFTSQDSLQDIQYYFKEHKKPFIIKKVIDTKIDPKFLKKNFGDQNVLALNDNSDKENLSMAQLIDKVNAGKKYRLRANTKIGNQIVKHIETEYIQKIKGLKKNPFDYLLSFGKTSRQDTLFLSSDNCTFAKHAHVISGLIFHLYGKKTWYISNCRESFWSIKYKSLLNPNPLYVTDKNLKKEITFTLEPGDFLYMPAYWFHYTHSNGTNISYSHFFTERIWYYMSRSFLMFMYQTITNPVYSFIKAIRKEPEEHIFDREDILDKCNKIKNKKRRNEALKFFKESDYS
jgi:ribosomal protein L16 Arg81 hydroxylase